MKVKEGDLLFLVESPDGFRIRPPDIENQMRVAKRVLKRHKKALRQLSKR